jgi:hypothetical protein
LSLPSAGDDSCADGDADMHVTPVYEMVYGMVYGLVGWQAFLLILSVD